MDIVFATDANYLMPTCVMLRSLTFHNPDARLHLLSDGSLTRENIRRMEDDAGRPISIYTFKWDVFPQCNGPLEYVSQISFSRLAMAEVLPEKMDKVLYLDVDTIIREDLTPLWETPLNDYAIGAVMDASNNDIRHFNRLRIPANAGLFNSGVLLINLAWWREHDAANIFRKYITDFPDRFYFHDQDVLNATLWNHRKPLPLKWNCQSAFFYKIGHVLYDWWAVEKELKEATANPAILHFITAEKPWIEGCLHPMTDEFFRYQAMTSWTGTPLLKPRKTPIQRQREILFRLHLRKRNPFPENPYR